MSAITNSDISQQVASPMGRKLASIRHIRNGADPTAIVLNEIDRQQQQLAQDTTNALEALRQRKGEITALIADLCDEVDAIDPQDVVADRIAKGATVIAEAKKTQNELFLAIESGEERLEREKQQRVQLEQMMQEYGDYFRSAGPRVPAQNLLLQIGSGISDFIAGGNL